MPTKEDYLAEYGLKESAPRNPPKESAVLFAGDAIAKKREELELKKLEIELSKLEKPDTSIDYYSKMLELQEKSFTQQLAMLQQQNELKLEIEKLKLMGDGESDSMLPYIQMLAPLLPSIIANKNNIPASKPLNSNDAGKSKVEEPTSSSPLINEKEVSEDMVAPNTAGELEEYCEEIRKGNISFEEAYEDFLTTPYANALTKEQFKAQFDKIKNG